MSLLRVRQNGNSYSRADPAGGNRRRVDRDQVDYASIGELRCVASTNCRLVGLESDAFQPHDSLIRPLSSTTERFSPAEFAPGLWRIDRLEWSALVLFLFVSAVVNWMRDVETTRQAATDTELDTLRSLVTHRSFY